MATASVAMDTQLYSHLLSPPFPSRFIDHIAVMFSEVAPWDQERKYSPSTVEACWRRIPKHDVIECCPFCTIIADVMNALASPALMYGSRPGHISVLQVKGRTHH